MIKNIILDIGNVMLDYSWRSNLETFSFTEDVKERVANAVFLNPDWNEEDRGVLTQEEMMKLFIENDPEIEKEIRIVMENIDGNLREYPYTNTWIPELQKMGYRVYLLSNFGEQQLHDSRKKMKFVEQADGALLSFKYQLIKPDDKIYQKLFEIFDLNPEECLFFDDREDNVEASIRNGMDAVVFTGYDDAMNRIKQEVKNK